MNPLTDDEVRLFHENGYHIFEQFFDAEECTLFKADIDQLTRDREAKQERYLCEYPQLGPLISHPRVMDVVAQVMGPGFAFHHLHAVRQEAGTPPVNWHQDYEQTPQTNRKHLMVHLFYYFNGLNGTIGDLMLVPRSQRNVVDNGALWILNTIDLPGSLVVNALPPGAAIMVHSALWHARRAQPGGEDRPRYFADASYCQAGVKWPAYGRKDWRVILNRALERNLDRDGKYAHLFDADHFFDDLKARAYLAKVEGSMLLQVPGWEEAVP